MSFFKTLDGHRYAVNDVAGYSRSFMDKTGGRGARKEALVTLKSSGEVVSVTDDEVMLIERGAATLIPAEVGTYLLDWFFEDEATGGVGISRQPVLAWRIGTFGGPERVVRRGDYSEPNDTEAILYPDGTVEGADGAEWASFEAWLAHARQATAKVKRIGRADKGRS